MSIVVENEQLDSDEFVDIDAEITSEEVSNDLEANIQDDIPEKFKGKELTDVVNSYKELEKELGRKNNEVGELRKLTDDFLKQKLEEPTEVKESNIDLDDLLENPNDVINKAVDNNPRITALEDQLRDARIAEQKAGFERKHENWQDVLSSEDFQNWIKDSSVRQNMFNQAHTQYDYEMADELLNLYQDVRGAAKEVAEDVATTKRKKALRNTSTGKGSTGEVTKKVYRRTDLIRLKQTDPQRYSDMQDEIMLAYTEGRVR